ncbi:MAG TPA: nuclear transport factor 2 family protein, partial [Caldimonas sp.]|nr:nuclear transport factor 2 family protein [Caldimonas sp.]
MSDPLAIASRYLATWNETDAQRRRRLLAETFTDDAGYVDPLMSGSGAAQLDGLIGGVHARFPGFRFAVLGTPDGHGDHVRFSWSLGPAGAEAPIKGSD